VLSDKEIQDLRLKLGELESVTDSLREEIRILSRKPSKLWAVLIFLIGLFLIGLSVESDSLVLVIGGLGSTFWGMFFIYSSRDALVKENVLISSYSSIAETLETILNSKGFKDIIYSPPSSSLTSSPVIAKMTVEEQRMQTKELLLPCPGSKLTALYERFIGTSFFAITLNELEDELSTAMIEILGIVKNVTVSTQDGSKVVVSLSGGTAIHLCRITSRSFRHFLCPICGSVACALCKATDKPIRIQESSIDGERINIVYTIPNM
jgi:hypothetical protein